LTVERLTARVTGRVQGVGFRWWVRRHAGQLGLSGWVMNGDDERTVELVAEGPSAQLNELERLVREGPPGASVDTVDVRREPASGEYDGFGIVKP
jgi:acylphosphatase